MTKSKKLLLLAGVLVVLIGVYLAVTLPGGENTPDISDGMGENEAPQYDFFTLDINDLVAFSYTLEGEEYAYTLSDDAASWTWDADTTLPISNGQVTMMMQAVLSLTSNYRLEGVSADKISDYGLADGADWVRFTYADGKSERLLFGKLNGYNGLVYCALDADLSTVYMVEASLPDTFAVKPAQIVENDALPTYKKTQFSGFMLEMNGGSYVAKYAYLQEDPAADEEKEITLYINNGEGEVLDAEARDALITEFLGWRLKDALTFDPQKYAEYGVTDDAASTLSIYYTYTMEYEDETTGTTNSTEVQGVCKLLLGNTAEGGKLCVRLSDGKGVYTLDMTELMALIAE